MNKIVIDPQCLSEKDALRARLLFLKAEAKKHNISLSAERVFTVVPERFKTPKDISRIQSVLYLQQGHVGTVDAIEEMINIEKASQKKIK